MLWLPISLLNDSKSSVAGTGFRVMGLLFCMVIKHT